MQFTTSTDTDSSLNETLVNELMDISLTRNESRAYLELLPFESATASELVKRTGIADSKIYYIMDSLQKKGLIILQEGIPKKFIAIPPVEALENLRAKFKKEYSTKIEILDRLGQRLTPIYQESEDSLKIAYIVKGKNNIANQAKRLIAEASSSLIIMLPNIEMYNLLEKSIKKAEKRVKPELGFYHNTVPQDSFPFDFKKICCECFFLIIDGNILLTVSNWKSDQSYAILTTEKALIEVSSGYFSSSSSTCGCSNSGC